MLPKSTVLIFQPTWGQNPKSVSFYTMLGSTVYHSNLVIPFDGVLLNLGSAYDPKTGIFTAPYGGTYQFTFSVCSTPNHWIVLEFYLNYASIDKIYAGDKYLDDCNSKTIFIGLYANGKVFLYHRSDGDTLMANGEKYGYRHLAEWWWKWQELDAYRWKMANKIIKTLPCFIWLFQILVNLSMCIKICDLATLMIQK